MSYQIQRTIGREVSFSGIGLHTGDSVTMRMKPAEPDSGIRFIRTDLPDRPVIEAAIENVTDVLRGTSIGKSDVKIHTVEHVLCAVAGLGISNLIIEIDGKEPPAGDGSALPYMRLIDDEAKIVNQHSQRKVLVIKEPIQIIEEDKQLICLPCETYRISFTIEYSNPVINTQYACYDITERTFREEFAAARTYGFTSEVDALKARGLALGGSIENAVVVADDHILNDSLRWPDEFVRHKILDLVGDLSLTGVALQAHVIGIKSGHSMNFQLAKKLKELSNRPENLPTRLDIKKIMEIIPHRYPFLLVDRIVHMEDNRAIGVKNVTYNEQFFQGHFPREPLMPGVLICEALAQVAGVFMLREEQHKGKIPFFGGIENFRFRRPIRPGDTVSLEIEVLKVRGNIGKVRGVARVDGTVAAEGVLTFSLM